MGSRIFLTVFTVVCLLMFSPTLLWGDNALVLPKGVSSLSANYYHYFDITQVYNSDGDAEDIGAAYNRPLDSTVFTDLSALDPFVPDGTATLGDAVFDATKVFRWWEFQYSYGISDKVSIGVLVPFNISEQNVDAYIDSTTADVGKNPLYTLAGFNPADPGTYPIIPVAFGGQPLTTEDVNALLGAGLDVDGDGEVLGPEPAGYGYDPIEDWSGSDLCDIEVLAKYKFYDEKPWRLAVTGGLRLPTGKEDDPDSLVDVASGDGQMDVIMRFHSDYVGLEKFFFNMTLEFDLQLPDKTTLRVPDDPSIPLTANREKVDRDLGDVVVLEFFGGYSLSREWSVGLKYEYARKFKDKVDGDLGLAYATLENGSDTTSHMGILSVGYSTIQAYLDGDASVPMDVGLAYRNRFAGENGVTKSEYISLSLGVYF